MKNPELFHKTIGILVNAYINDTLEYTDCRACAVGNLVAANNGLILKKENGVIVPSSDFNNGIWFYPISAGSGHDYILKTYINTKVLEQIKTTGYSLEEVADLEQAFFVGVGGNDYNSTDKEHFNGLMSVCDALMQIHEATTEEIKEAKSLFVKELAV